MRKALAVLLTVLVLPASSKAELKKSMKKECLVCHENWLLEAKVNSPKLLTTKSYEATDRLMCLSCHDGSLADDRETFLGFSHFSHPVDKEIPEGFKLPKGFPSKDGKLYCGTCHTPHTKTGSEKKLDYTFMRKPNVNSALCIECHKENSKHGINHPILEDTEDKLTEEVLKKVRALGGRVTENNEVQCESCHSPHRGRAKKALLEPVEKSELCIVCHTDNLNSKEHPDYRNHPIHKDFPKGAKLALFEEKKAVTESVECMTCHRVHKEENKHLLVAKERELCSLCHVEEGKVNFTDHNIDNKSCKSCHTPHKAKGPKLWSRDIPEEAFDYASIIDAKGKNDVLCLSCHYTGNVIHGKEIKTVGTLTHPTGKRVEGKVKLPLTDGKLSCTTCHNPHHAFNDRKDGKFLRKEKLALCATCHKDQLGVRKGAHGKIEEKRWKKGDCAACHNVHNAKGGYLSRVVYGEISPMEPAVDGFCLACHDPEGMAKHKVKKSIYSEHPVGVKNPSDKLPGKKISCVTCHEPHSHEEELLRIPVRENSALCLNCHTDKSLKGTPHDILHNPDVKLSKKEKEELLKGGACSACHTPHNPEYKVLWSRKLGKGKTVNERMCSSCHAEGGLAADKTVGEHTHPTGREITQKNLKMIKGSRLPLISQMTALPAKRGETGVLGCATCHEPHNGADKKRLTRYTVEGDSSLCTACHTAESTVIGTDHDLRVVGKGKELKAGVCSACHVPHNAKDKFLWAKEVKEISGNRMADYCLSCHTAGGVGEKKVVKYYYHPSKDVVVKNLDRPGREGDWPLFNSEGEKVKVGGQVVCETCHNPHRWNSEGTAPGKPVEGNALNSFLRNRTLKGSICVDCHGLDALYRYKFFHDKRAHQRKPSYR